MATETDATRTSAVLAAHRGSWVVLDKSWQQVIASSKDPQECMRKAREMRDRGEVFIYKVPAESAPPIEQ